MKKLALLAVLVLASCEPNAAFQIIPSASAAVPDQVLKLALSQAVPGVVWSATAGSITGVGNNATYVAPGCAPIMPIAVTVTATAGAFTATASVTVTDVVTGVSVTPTAASVPALGSTTFVALVKTTCAPAGVVAGVLRVPAPAAAKAAKK